MDNDGTYTGKELFEALENYDFGNWRYELMLLINTLRMSRRLEITSESAQAINPSKVVLKKNVLNILVGNKNDYDLLTQGLVGMKNVKWIGILLEEVA
jgi:hypothetical protein